MDDDGEPPYTDRYPALGRTPHRWRSRRANAIAASALIVAILLVVLVLALG